MRESCELDWIELSQRVLVVAVPVEGCDILWDT
jgi:hypothetical protein